MRTLSFDVDVKHAKSVNENYADLRRLRISSLLVGGVVTAGGIVMTIFGSAGYSVVGAILILLGLGAASMYLYLPRKVGTIEDQYLDSPLVAATVTDTRRTGFTLLGLVNVSRRPDADPRYALVARAASSLTGPKPVVGAKVPCVAVLADRSSRPKSPTWQSASLMPIAWGTTDPKVLADAAAQISGAEWDLLNRSKDRAETIRTSRDQMELLAAEQLPRALREGE